MARRPVAVVAAIVLLVEARRHRAAQLASWRLVVDRQDMSLAGLDPDAMSTGTWVGGRRLRPLPRCCAAWSPCWPACATARPGRVGRILLISCAVVHGVLGALTVGLVGWAAFAFMMVVLGLIVLTLWRTSRERGPERDAPAAEGGARTRGGGAGPPRPVGTGARAREPALRPTSR